MSINTTEELNAAEASIQQGRAERAQEKSEALRLRYPFTDHLVAELKAYAEKNGLTHKKVASQLDYGLTQVTKYLGGKPDFNTGALEHKIRDLLRTAERREKYRVELFPTGVSRQVNAVCETIRKTDDFGLIHSPAGWGKSSGLKLYTLEYTLAVPIEVNRFNRGANDQTRLLWDQAGTGGALKNRETRANWLVRVFKDSHRPILIDNAHRLTRGGLQFWFDFHDATGVPIVFFGNPEVLEEIKKNDQMYSRLGLIEMVSLPENEYEAVARRLIQQTLQQDVPELEDLAVETISRRGHLRALRKQLNLAREIRELKGCDWPLAFKAAGTKLIRAADEDEISAPTRGGRRK